MTDDALIFEQIAIRRALGIGVDEPFEINGLKPGINLIEGPNGSGKTTTARVAQALIWPDGHELDRPWISGRLRLHGAAWEVHIEAGRVQFRRDGRVCDGPALGPPTARRRYYLSLHELLRDDSDTAAFAREVAKVVQGGLDLQSAVDRLGFREKPPRRHNDRRQLAELRQKIDAARANQREVETLSRGRQSLERRKENAVAAAGNVHLLETAIEYRKKSDRCDELQRQLDDLPAGVSRLRGDEDARLKEIEDRRHDLDRQQHQLERQIAEQQEKLDEANLPEEGLPSQMLIQLQAQCRDLHKLSQAIEGENKRLAEHRRQLSDARRRLGGSITDAQLERLDRIEEPELTALCRESQRLRGRRQSIQDRQKSLAADDREPAESADDLATGVGVLTDWLAAGSAGADHRRGAWLSPATVGAAALAALAIVLAIAVHWAWAAVLLVPIGLLVWHRLEPNAGGEATATDHRPAFQRQYQRLSLPQPAQWEPEAVTEMMHTLTDRLADARLADRRASLREQADRDEQELTQAESDLAEKLDQIRQRLGVPEQIVSDEWLAVLADNIARWQHAGDVVAAAAEALETDQQRHDDLLATINTTLSRYGYQPATTASEAAGLVDQLNQRQQNHANAKIAINHARQSLREKIEPERQAVQQQHERFFADLGLDAGDDATLRDWLKLKPRYDALTAELNSECAVRDDRRQKLADHPQLLEPTAERLEQDLADNRSRAEEVESLTRRISEIDERVRQAKQGHELTDALAEYDAEAAAFQRKREADARDVLGSLVRDHVQHAGGGGSQPEVLQRATAYLGRFTHHRLALELDSRSDPPAFVARDTVRGLVKPIDQLSTGERVQLLMAVRMGFVEHEERVKLPLILDEVLGTSDDERTFAVMDAVIEIARAGRQVFYFTAQQDELAKWRSRLERSGLGCEAIDLRRIRGEAAAKRRPLQTPAITVPSVPSPDGQSHAEYGRELRVPELDPWVESLDGLHLWHLIDDPQRLYQVLWLGVQTWGQLAAMLEHGGRDALPDADRIERQARAAVRAIEVACDGWRHGRGKRLDPIVLSEADGVTDRFAGPLGKLCETCNGDARRLLERAADEIDGWGPAKTDRLREFLHDAGYYDPRPPLPDEQIGARVRAAVADDLKRGDLSPEWIERLLSVFSPAHA